jgi:3-phenylpropionate/trans-cinnamate dioxygenase ferredoxin reductase subunit
VLLVGREAEPPYDRPPLSKDYLRGESERSDAIVEPASWYEERGIELRTGTSVMKLDAEERVAKLQGGEEVEFDQALIATGAMVNILRVDGAQLEGIHYLRAFGNSDSIRDDVADRERIAIVGGSYIGAEVAASLTEMGKRCTIIEIEDVLLSRGFGEEVGRHFHQLLESKGVEILAGETVAAFEGDERVGAVLTESGREIACDAVVVGAGVRPDTMLAGRAGLEVDDGIVCDAALQSSVGGIFAAGDCCSYESEIHGRRLRIEHWDVAFHQGRHAAAGMLGELEPYRVVPYFFSDLADWASLEYVGPAERWDDVVWRGDRAAGEFSAWYLADDHVVAALAVGRSEDLQQARRLIEAGRPLGPGRGLLEDPGSDLDEIG